MRGTSGYFLSDLIGFVVEVRWMLSLITQWQTEDAEDSDLLKDGLNERLTYLVSFSMSLDKLLADVIEDMNVAIGSRFTISFSAVESVEVDISKLVPGKDPLEDAVDPFKCVRSYSVVIDGRATSDKWDREMNWRHRNRFKKIRKDYKNNPRFKYPPQYPPA